MNTYTRCIAVIVALLGVAGIVFGIMSIIQAGSAEQEIADELQPLPIAQVDATYEAVKTAQEAQATIEAPGIQAGTAAPSTTYNYLTIQRTSLGLTRTNIGLVSFIRTSGILNIIVGLGLILAGVGLLKKSQSAV